MPKPKRNKLEIYHDILNAISQELTDGKVKPTRVQVLCNLAYDKLARYLDELEGKKMIVRDPLAVTDRGRDFLQDYDKIKYFVRQMGIKYLDDTRSEIYER